MKSDILIDMYSDKRKMLIANQSKKLNLEDLEELISSTLNVSSYDEWNLNSMMPVYDITIELEDFIVWLDTEDIIKEKVTSWQKIDDILALIVDINDLRSIPELQDVNPRDPFTWINENFIFWKIDSDKFQNFAKSLGFDLSIIAYYANKNNDSWEYVSVLFVLAYNEKFANEFRGLIATRKFNF
jgi:hypothetical protein